MFNEQKEKLEMNENNAEIVVPKGSQVVCVMELVYLSLSKTTISTKWKMVQARVAKNKESINGYAMLDDDSSEQQEDLDTNNEEEQQKDQEEQQVGLDVEENVKVVRKKFSKLNV
jgi:hypothetical protein